MICSGVLFEGIALSLPDENCQSVIETLRTKFLPFTAIVQDSAISTCVVGCVYDSVVTSRSQLQ